MPIINNTQPIFSGEFRHALDPKNRITIPARWRKSDSDEFFLVPDQTDSFLLVMPPDEFKKVPEMVAGHATVSNQEQRIFIRQFYSRSHNVASDKQGRLLLPEDHCKQVGLKQEVVLVGSLNRFEIWNSERWKKFQEKGKSTYQKVADLAGL